MSITPYQIHTAAFMFVYMHGMYVHATQQTTRMYTSHRYTPRRMRCVVYTFFNAISTFRQVTNDVKLIYNNKVQQLGSFNPIGRLVD